VVELSDAPIPAYRHRIEGFPYRWCLWYPQAAVHLRNDSATVDNSAAVTAAYYARPGHVFFDERSFNVTTLAVDSSERLGKSGKELVH